MKCVSCLQGFKWECRDKGECNESSLVVGGIVDDPGLAIGSLLGNLEGDVGNPAQDSLRDSGHESDPDPDKFVTYKDDSSLRDQQSTGRKRAAKLFPLDSEASCEWKMQKNCGGGQFPIVGCLNGFQQARHHGPDKNTLNNEKGNVHRICHTCHNRWHTLNDPDYVWGGLHNAHDPCECTIVDVGNNEVFWSGRKVVKAKD